VQGYENFMKFLNYFYIGKVVDLVQESGMAVVVPEDNGPAATACWCLSAVERKGESGGTVPTVDKKER
jgi:hypothetical protein